jgi:ABC-type nitrate/sulfonate/bicarbonate transport system substrate-binding protein
MHRGNALIPARAMQMIQSIAKLMLSCIIAATSIIYSGTEPAQAQQAANLIIGYPARSIGSIQLFIAQEKGYFREEGLPQVSLTQIRADGAKVGMLTGELFVHNSVGTSVRAVQAGAPLKILTINLQSPLFWLVTRPELKTFNDLKGKVLGTTSFGGVQHLAGLRMLRKGGLNPEKDVTVILAGDTQTQFQSLVSGAIQMAVLSPPTVILAREKFKLNVLGNALDEFPSFFQSGLAAAEKTVMNQRSLMKQVLRAQAKANRFFFENEVGASEVIAKFLKVELPVALESYRISRKAFSPTGIVSEKQIEEFLKIDGGIMKVAEPMHAMAAFDSTLQREVNQELGIK